MGRRACTTRTSRMDRLKVSTTDGTAFAAGKTVRVEATVWAYSTYSSDKLDLYYAANANSPSWTLLGTLSPTKAGSQVLSATYTLPAGALQAVRANFRYGGSASACAAGSYTDHDDSDLRGDAVARGSAVRTGGPGTRSRAHCVWGRGNQNVERSAAVMPRQLTRDEEDRFMAWARERDRLILALQKASIQEKVQAYKQLEKRILKETRTPYEKQEMQRRITEDLLMATMAGPWRGFSPYLRRMERLGYSSMDCRLLVCSWAAQASKGSPAGMRKTAALIAAFERRARAQKLRPEFREQINVILTRARKFADLDDGKTITLKKTAAGKRRSAV